MCTAYVHLSKQFISDCSYLGENEGRSARSTLELLLTGDCLLAMLLQASDDTDLERLRDLSSVLWNQGGVRVGLTPVLFVTVAFCTVSPIRKHGPVIFK